MDVCQVNRAVYGNFICLALTFAEGACDKVPKTVRTFENFWQPRLLLVHHDFWQRGTGPEQGLAPNLKMINNNSARWLGGNDGNPEKDLTNDRRV